MKHTLHFLTACLLLITMTTSCKKDEGCPQGFQGSDCNEQITPSKMFITAVRVTKFPALDNGASWDDTNGPDIYFQVYNTAAVIYDQPSFFPDADSSQDYDMDVTAPIELASPTDQYGIQLYDFDEGISTDDFMGGILFVPYFNTTGGFPTTITLDGTLVSFVITVTYEW